MGGIFSVISKLFWGEAKPVVMEQMNTDEGVREMEQLVAQVSEVKRGEMKEVSLGEGKVLLCRDAEGEFSAVGSKCTHYAAPLKNGAYGDNRVRCPWHGACFNTKTGDIEDFPGMDGLPVFEVRVQGNDVYVKGDLDEVRTSKRTGHMCAGRGDGRLFVIVGGGAAGAACAQTLRKSGFAGRIVVVCKETVLPYDRPKLSKAMTVTLNSILLRTDDFWAQHGVEFKLGTVVTELDAATKTITTETGEKINYDACLVATGGTPRGLPVPAPASAGPNGFPNVFLLRDFEQAAVIDSEATGKKVLIVGSSFIGMEIAAAISAKASSILVIGMEKVPFERVLGAEIGAAMQALHESKGIKFQMQATLKDVRHDGKRVTSVVLNSGEEIECDMICVGAGVFPTTSFIRGVELAKPDNSLLCDANMKVEGVEGLYAAGDIARFPLKMLNNRLARIEHWGMAQKQGQVAAFNMLGKPDSSLDSIPYFWTGMYGKTVRYCGHGLDVDEVIMDGASFDPASLKFLAFYSSKGKIVAVASVARDPLVSICAELMHHNKMPSTEDIKAAIASDASAEKLIRSLLEQQ
jgi:NADPH-dependent 2,4-dienoyl-CoA reductase/sulfur reductase-like enzyme/nitrite reductase/ring-hydroxylating ferredoxin subunit